MRVVRLVGAVIGWVLLMAGVSVGSWYAIDRAGHAVGGPGVRVDVLTLPAPASPSPAPSAASASVSPTTPSAPTTSSPPRGSASPSPSASSSAPTPWPSPRGQPHSVSLAGGGLVARCDGDELTYWSVRPASGWRIATAQTSASVLVVTSAPAPASTSVSTSASTPTPSEVVRATCRDGALSATASGA